MQDVRRQERRRRRGRVAVDVDLTAVARRDRQRRAGNAKLERRRRPGARQQPPLRDVERQCPGDLVLREIDEPHEVGDPDLDRSRPDALRRFEKDDLSRRMLGPAGREARLRARDGDPAGDLHRHDRGAVRVEAHEPLAIDREAELGDEARGVGQEIGVHRRDVEQRRDSREAVRFPGRHPARREQGLNGGVDLQPVRVRRQALSNGRDDLFDARAIVDRRAEEREEFAAGRAAVALAEELLEGRELLGADTPVGFGRVRHQLRDRLEGRRAGASVARHGRQTRDRLPRGSLAQAQPFRWHSYSGGSG